MTNSELTPVPGSTIVEQLPSGLKDPLDRILHNHVPGSEPFSRLGWLDEAMIWIQASVPAGKIPFTGKTSQFNASGQFQLIRFDTERPPAYWLKATGHPNTHEYAITTFLASRTPEYLPRIVAVRPDWNAWVMEEHGQSLYHALSLATAKIALVRLAELQQRWVGQEAALLAHGCHDHRLHILLTQIDAIIDYLDEAMRRQTSTKVAPMSRERLVALGEILKDTCAAALELPIPDTLLHNDISPGSILFDRSTCVFSDWAEAYLGNPFLTLQQFCSHLEHCRSEAVEWIPELRSLYGQCWMDRLGALRPLSLNKLPQTIRDACRQDPTVPKNVLVEIARKKQERSMLTKYNQYRDKQAKAAAKEQETGAPATRKRTKAEALAEGIGNTASKIDDIDFPSFSAEDRAMLIESMNALKDILEPAITRAVKNKKKPT